MTEPVPEVIVEEFDDSNPEHAALVEVQADTCANYNVGRESRAEATV